MRLLFDQNLSPRLTALLVPFYAKALHVRDIGMQRASDDAIWHYAKANRVVIVSKDSDFYQKGLLRGSPPKIIWLRLGNCSTDEVVEALRRHHDDVEAFCADPSLSFLALGSY